MAVRNSVVRVLCPLFAFIIALVFFVTTQVLVATGHVTRRGFYCNDESIRYPFAKQASFPTWALVVYILILPLIFITIGSVFTRYVTKTNTPFHVQMPFRKWRISSSILLPLMLYAWYVFGLMLLNSSVDSMKLYVGELRPHFITVCDPDFSLLNCTQGVQENPVYIADYKCRGDPKQIIESRLSFPSGHGAASTYAGVFTALYISKVPLFSLRSPFQLLLMVFILLGPALISLSRLVDNRHHPHDVAFGAALGAASAALLVYFNLHYFNVCKKQTADPESTENNEVLCDEEAKSSIISP